MIQQSPNSRVHHITETVQGSQDLLEACWNVEPSAYQRRHSHKELAIHPTSHPARWCVIIINRIRHPGCIEIFWSFWNVRVPNSIQRRCCFPISSDSSQVFHHVLPTSNGHSIHINMTLRAHLVIQNHIKFRATSPSRFWPFGCPGHGKSKVSKMSEVPGTIAVSFPIHHSKAITITKKNVQHHKFLTQNHKENQS